MYANIPVLLTFLLHLNCVLIVLRISTAELCCTLESQHVPLFHVPLF